MGRLIGKNDETDKKETDGGCGPFRAGVDANRALGVRAVPEDSYGNPPPSKGTLISQFNLGLMYTNGDGVTQNYRKAAKWVRRAAKQGNAEAQYSLGLMYNHGEGVPQDYQKALKWYRLAAERGHAPAQNNLGVMYDDGDGVPQDYIQANKWLNLADPRSPGEVMDNYRLLRDKLAEIMTAAQVAEAQRLAREWRPKSWEQLKDQ